MSLHKPEIKMTSKPITTNAKPQFLIKSTLYKTKKFFTKSFSHLQSFIPTNKRPKTPTFVVNSKVQELDDFYTSFSEKCGANSVEELEKKACNISRCAEGERDEQECSGLEELKEERKMRKGSGRKQEETSAISAHVLAQRMKDLQMMDLNDMDHAMDVEEVLHYYSRINCPTYVEIVDNFFMDMYSEFHVPNPSGSLNNSMRKLGSQSLHSSMRTLGPIKL